MQLALLCSLYSPNHPSPLLLQRKKHPAMWRGALNADLTNKQAI